MISHEHRFIFVHASRTGGSSLERMAGVPPTEDVRTRALGNTDFPDKHASFQHYRDRYPDEFRTHFKFTIVRNPFERLHSSWTWRTEVVRDLQGMPLRTFIESRPPDYAFAALFRLDGLSIEESIDRFDHVARFERLADEYRFLRARLGLAGDGTVHANRTERGRYEEAYDAATIELVRERFGRDLALFGYEFGG